VFLVENSETIDWHWYRRSVFGSNCETDEENGSKYEPSSDEDEDDAIADDDSEQTSEVEKYSRPSGLITQPTNQS
jgi:hypothetical protein